MMKMLCVLDKEGGWGEWRKGKSRRSGGRGSNVPSKVALITDSSRFQVECLLSAPQQCYHIYFNMVQAHSSYGGTWGENGSVIVNK